LAEEVEVKKIGRRVVAIIASWLIALTVLPAVWGLLAAGALVFGNVSGEHGEWVDAVFGEGNMLIIVSTVFLVAWTVRAVIEAVKQAVDLYDLLDERREFKAQVKALGGKLS
jgi:hypothetical protein